MRVVQSVRSVDELVVELVNGRVRRFETAIEE